jgi:hypothetical protein
MLLADLGEVLGSPIWTVLATVFAAVTIGVSIWLARRNRTRKDMSYEVNVTELVSVHSAASDAKGRIKIYFDDEEIEQVHLVEARIENTGNVPIKADDFDQPLMVELGENARPLTVDVADVTPADLRATASSYKTGAVLAPLLLNPGDGLTLKILARNLRRSPECHYRVVGISKMSDAAAQRQRQSQRTFLRNVFSDFPLESLAAVLILGTLALAGSGIHALFVGDQKSETLVQEIKGKEFCGKVLHASEQRVVLQLVHTGKIRGLPMREVRSIQYNSC